MNQKEVMRRFAANLKQLRSKAGFTQTELSKLSKVSQGGIAHWENGIREPSWTAVVALAEALGVAIATFLDEPDEQPTQDEEKPKRARRKGA